MLGDQVFKIQNLPVLRAFLTYLSLQLDCIALKI